VGGIIQESRAALSRYTRAASSESAGQSSVKNPGQILAEINNATVKRYHYDDHAQLRRHLADFIDAYNFELSPIFGDGLKDQAAAVWG